MNHLENINDVTITNELLLWDDDAFYFTFTVTFLNWLPCMRNENECLYFHNEHFKRLLFRRVYLII